MSDEGKSPVIRTGQGLGLCLLRCTGIFLKARDSHSQAPAYRRMSLWLGWSAPWSPVLAYIFSPPHQQRDTSHSCGLHDLLIRLRPSLIQLRL